jgi:hypothetical protein
MKLSDKPTKLVLPFAGGSSTYRRDIPVDSQIPITPGAASWTDGFPPLTRTPVSSGGIPPSGLDMNGALFEMSAVDRWFNAGAGFPFDATFAADADIGGYPKGSRVLNAAGTGYWISIIDDNSNDPDAGGAGWVPEGSSRPVASVYASEQQTLASGVSKIAYDTVEFDSFGLWDATNHRFKALWDGKYRVNGSVFLSAPDGQNLGTQIKKNGVLAKLCSQFPQVSDVDLSLPFEAIISLAATDYIEAFLNVTGSAVLAGVVGSNQAYVFSQIEYLGS